MTTCSRTVQPAASHPEPVTSVAEAPFWNGEGVQKLAWSYLLTLSTPKTKAGRQIVNPNPAHQPGRRAQQLQALGCRTSGQCVGCSAQRDEHETQQQPGPHPGAAPELGLFDWETGSRNASRPI